MTFKTLDKLLDDKQLLSFIHNISAGVFEVPYLMKKLAELLSDTSPLLNMIPDDDKIALAKLIKKYFDGCWGIYMDNMRLDLVVKAGKMEIYKVEAPNGIRYATVNEINNGVIGLLSEKVYPAGIDNYKKLALLHWTFSGNSYYFREAGHKLTFNKDGKVEETFLELLNDSLNELEELIAWADTDSFENSVNTIKKVKSRGFKYASYEKDEIEETISIKQLIYNIDRAFPRNSNDPEYRRALSLVIKGKQSFKSLTPMEVSFMRKAYLKRALDRDIEPRQPDEQLKSDCEYILSKRYSGEIDQNDFVYKIITTLKNKSYMYCSQKQRVYIDCALKKLRKKETVDENALDTENNNIKNIVDEDDISSELEKFNSESIVDISEAIGQGLLFDDEEDY